jgi:hypothetical protein
MNRVVTQTALTLPNTIGRVPSHGGGFAECLRQTSLSALLLATTIILHHQRQLKVTSEAG